MGKRTIIHGAEAITCVGAKSVPNSVVVIEGDAITQVVPASGFDVEAAGKQRHTTVIDATGKYLTPGLVNLHEHLDNHRGTGSFQERLHQPTEYGVIRGSRNLLISLAYGVTTVRDTGSKDATNIAFRNAVEAGQAIGPRIFPSGSPICMTGGHGAGLAIEADGPDAVRAAARQQLKQGADVIKLMASGGFVSLGNDHPWAPQLTEEEIRAACEEAHKSGKTVACHAHPPEAIKVALAGGVDTIEHGALMNEESVALIEKHGAYLVPTLDETHMIAERGEELGRPKWLIDVCRKKADGQAEIFGLAARAKLRCGVGTDVAGEMGREMSHMAAAGMSNMDALLAGTINGAKVLHFEDRIGTIEAGKFADLVVLDRDPRADLRACDEPTLVFKGGVAYDPAALVANLGPNPS
ncbi:MAG: amidohydrolase family protein [Micromonosporaceae bacterium]|nr:amidohydrolase family protein [Micromonosporaceae bacterium]